MKIPLVNIVLFAILVVVLVAYPLVAEQAYLTYTLMVIFAYALIGLFYNLLLGYLGIPFLAPMALFAVGGYTAGYISLTYFNPILGIVMGGIFASASSLTFSLLSMRLRGLYMALYSLVFTLFFQQLIGRQDVPILYHIFFGAIGQNSIPDIQTGTFLWRSDDGIAYYYLALGVLIVSTIILWRILKSKYGTAFRGIRDAETYASTLGVGIFRTKIIAFAITGFFIGIAGAILTMFYGQIGPNILDTSNMLLFLTMVVFGGLGTFFGPVVGALILVPLDNYLTSFGAYRLLVWGLAVLIVVLVAPEGAVGKIENLLARFRKRDISMKREEAPKDSVAVSARTA
jgi:branched-chain amino acid transport system permease protein